MHRIIEDLDHKYKFYTRKAEDMELEARFTREKASEFFNLKTTYEKLLSTRPNEALSALKSTDSGGNKNE